MRFDTALMGRDLAIDLGTATTVVYVRGEGVVLTESSVVAIDQTNGALIAVGDRAKEMLGRTPDDVVAVRPLRHGVIADFEAAQDMLRDFVQRAQPRRALAKPRIVLAVPSAITGVERRAVEDAGYAAGARRVFLIEAPMAAAIGAGLPVYEAAGSMVVDIGGGTTEAAVISLGGVVVSHAAPVGGDALDRALVDYVKAQYSLLLGARTAERVKLAIGSAYPSDDEPDAEIRGRDLVTGLPRTVVISAAEVRQALDEPITEILAALRTTLDRTPPELAGDIMDRGIVLTGGGALLTGLPLRLSSETRMPVRVAPDALRCVALGAGRTVEEFADLQPLLRARSRR